MGLLHEKLVELHEKDDDVRAEMEDAKAVKKDAGKVTEIDASHLSFGLVSRAKAHVHLDFPAPESFAYKGVRIAIADVRIEGDMLSVTLAASCPTFGPYLFHNPPLQAEAGKDDPAAALRIMVGDAVLMAARQHGWGAGPPCRR